VDVVIIGAGPAGLALGCYLSKAGIRHVVLEKANHPRPHVGESINPAALRVLDEIDFLHLMNTSEFVQSHGVAYHPEDGDRTIPIAYREFPQEGVLQDHTYHIDRSKFDLLLMKHAEDSGSHIVQGASVREVLMDEQGRATGVRVEIGDQSLDLSADIIVDASGQATLMGRQLGLRKDEPALDQFSLHAWFVDVDRGEKKTADYTHVYFLPGPLNWAWRASITHEVTSIGVVAERSGFKESGLSPEEFFESRLASNPTLAAAVAGAGAINLTVGEVNYSYSLSQACGYGWLAVGDAARFLDPMFGSGVSAALHSAKFAAEVIIEALASGDTSRESLLPYEERVFAGAAVWDKFIRLFYRLRPALLYFLEDWDHRMDVLQLLQGEAYDRERVYVLEELEAFVHMVESDVEHPLRAALAEVAAD
jgi:FADH2 O2-dependent halogenase